MNETLNRWIKKFKHWINPRDPYQNEFVEDDLYRGRRSAKRRHRRLVMRRWSILIGNIILVCAVLFGGVWGISKTLYASKVDRLQTRIDRLYVDSQHSDLKKNVTKQQIATLKHDIAQLKDRPKKPALQKAQNQAANAYQVRQDYQHLFNRQNRVDLKVTTKKVNHQMKALSANSVPQAFDKKYREHLQKVRQIVQTADKLSRRYNTIIKAHQQNQKISVSTIDGLIKDMRKNQQSQRTVDEQTKLISLRSIVNKENKAAEKAAREAAIAAQKEAEEEAARKAAEESASKEASKSASKAAEASSKAAAESSSKAAEESAAAASSAEEESSSYDSSYTDGTYTPAYDGNYSSNSYTNPAYYNYTGSGSNSSSTQS